MKKVKELLDVLSKDIDLGSMGHSDDIEINKLIEKLIELKEKRASFELNGQLGYIKNKASKEKNYFILDLFFKSKDIVSVEKIDISAGEGLWINGITFKDSKNVKYIILTDVSEDYENIMPKEFWRSETLYNISFSVDSLVEMLMDHYEDIDKEDGSTDYHRLENFTSDEEEELLKFMREL